MNNGNIHPPDLVRLHEKTMADTTMEVAALRKEIAVQTGEIRKGIHRIETQTLEKLVGGVAQEAAQAQTTAKAAHSRIDLLDSKFGFIMKLFFGGGGIVAIVYVVVQLFRGG